MSQLGKTYGEFQIGAKDKSPAVTITDAHIILFASLSGDYNPLHIDEEFAKKTPFKTRIAHGLLSVSVLSGYLGQLLSGTAIAFLGAHYKFTAPVKIGDTIHAETEIINKKDVAKYNGGVVTIKMQIKNQRGEVCVDGEASAMVSNTRLW
ncbi:MAG: MaoC family dehydratase N-terminal domain-containing protein [Candidatus Freyarchaeota archaeon]|nr:MaoC family dehydratase N-terminal domain-containing protein [Candidatus Jordarchaeia archaeon]MBS7269507.1 MaoC family dehydratase N-terminal domain-containing protein [Candidatus Jordarchaeia archaeon]MBS7280904.1 MaoC family dehydratase N-terminal domain-containing protein [Candidatus Jordarchaeia archaeon]